MGSQTTPTTDLNRLLRAQSIKLGHAQKLSCCWFRSSLKLHSDPEKFKSCPTHSWHNRKCHFTRRAIYSTQLSRTWHSSVILQVSHLPFLYTLLFYVLSHLLVIVCILSTYTGNTIIYLGRHERGEFLTGSSLMSYNIDLI